MHSSGNSKRGDPDGNTSALEEERGRGMARGGRERREAGRRKGAEAGGGRRPCGVLGLFKDFDFCWVK